MGKLEEDRKAKCIEYALRIVEVNPTAYKPEPLVNIADSVIKAAEKLEKYIET